MNHQKRNRPEIEENEPRKRLKSNGEHSIQGYQIPSQNNMDRISNEISHNGNLNGNLNGSINSKSKIMDAGQIEYIRLENFMCHRNLEVHFTSGVNVVTGNNGSGKSAILAGLQVALGSKAKSTNRGTSIKEVIKEGEDSCRVTVHLSNYGPDAFEPQKYGKKIIIVRRLSKNAGTYKIQSEDGQVISSSVKDLRAILDHFNIHLDNPCTVMNQDVSRLFLANETSTSKYRFFLEATQLQKMMDSFDESIKHKNEMERAIEQKQESLKDSERELDQLKKEFEDASHLKDLDRQIANLDNEILWAAVAEKELLLKRFEDKHKEVEAEYKEMVEANNKIIKEKLEIEQKFEIIKNQLSEKTNEFSSIDVTLLGVNEEYTKVKKESGIIQRNIDDWELRIRQSSQRINSYENEIKKLELQSIETSKSNEHEKKKQSLENAIRDYENEIEKNRSAQEEAIEASAHAENEVQEAASLLNNYEDRMRKVAGKLEQIRKSNKDPLSYFQPDMIKLIKEISAKKRSFRKVPIGPIGLMIKVKNLKWAGTVELALKNLLSSFIVDNSDDRHLLLSLAKKYNIKISAITQRFKSEIYSDHELRNGGIPDKRYLTILNIITTNDNQSIDINYSKEAYSTAINVLIDQGNIAQTILANDDEEAKRIMFQQREPPLHALACFSMNGSKFQKKGFTEVVDPRNSVFSTLWSDDMREITQQLEKEKLEHQEHVRLQREELKKVEKESRVYKSQISNLRDNEQKILRQLRSAQQNLTKLNQETIVDPVDKYNEDIAFKRIQIQEELEKQASFKESIEKFTKDNYSIVSKTNSLSQKINELKEKKNSIKIEMSSLTQQLENIKNSIQIFESNISKNERAIAAHDKTVSLLLENIKEKKFDVEESIKVAVEICPDRLNPTFSVEEIRDKRKALNKIREQEQERFGGRSVAQIEAAYVEFLRAYTHAKESISGAETCFNTFKDSLTTRYNKWANLRKYYVDITTHWFNTFLTQKGHSGKLEFDLETGTLDTVVYFSSNDGRVNEVRDTKSLSGGERSFATTALLLALWKAMESPFRCLDEFDVFMDAVYRKKAFDLLLDDSLRTTTKQLLIITPLNVSMLKENANIIRLKPPARDGLQQTTLYEFGQAQ